MHLCNQFIFHYIGFNPLFNSGIPVLKFNVTSVGEVRDENIVLCIRIHSYLESLGLFNNTGDENVVADCKRTDCMNHF